MAYARASEGLVRLGPVLVLELEARALGAPRGADPDLAVRVQAAAARGGHGGRAGTVQQPRVGGAAVGMETAVGDDRLVPGRLALGQGRGIVERGAVEL